MTRTILAVATLLLGFLIAGPAQAAILEGTIESVSGNTASIRSDDGGVFAVDLSGIAAAGRGAATPGQHVTVEGNYTQDVAFTASSVAAGVQSPGGTPTINGTLQSVSGKTLMVQSYDGGIFTVDASQVASLPQLRPGDAVTVKGNYPGSVTIAAEEIRATPKPQDGGSRQAWQRVHGRVESVQGRALTFRADDGRALNVDMTRVGQRVQRALTPGEGATLVGVPGASANQFTARYIQQDSSDRSRANLTSPQPGAAGQTPAAIIEGTVDSVSGTTAMVRSDDGGVFTVDLASVAAAGRSAVVPGQHVTVEGNYTRDVTFVASSIAPGVEAPTGPTIHGTVESVSGKTMTVRSYDGGLFTVDAAQVASVPALRQGDVVTVKGNYPGDVTIAARDVRASTKPQAAAQAGRQWQRVHGRVERVQDRTLTFKADDGRTLTVDMSRVSRSVQRALTPGEGATVVGFAGSSANQLTARYIQQDSSRTGPGQPAASPATTK